jgi:DNA topoisomerase-6 subunit B
MSVRQPRSPKRAADQGSLFGDSASSSAARAKKPAAKAKGNKARDGASAPEKKAPATAAPTKKSVAKSTSVARRKPSGGGRGPKAGAPRTAADMAKNQREISVSEFFAKNRHLLGFDNPKKSLLTTVKEAVDNALDACEEARIRPDIRVEIEELKEGRYRCVIEDNGPGIVKAQLPHIFGQLLYGSKFHAQRQSRGQQGIGISAAALYAQLTTGKPITVVSRTGPRKPAHEMAIQIDTNRNAPVVANDREIDWDKKRGTRITLELEGLYQKGRRGVDGFIEATALANPHAEITYKTPKIEETVFERSSKELPVEPREIKPHPHGIELGLLMKMLKDTKSRNVTGFLQSEFSRVSSRVATSILDAASLKPTTSPARIHRDAAEELYNAIQAVKIMAPPTDCLSPIGAEAIAAALRSQVDADLYIASTRSPSVYRGNPFQVEAGIAFGGKLPGDDLAVVHRFANRVPLLYQQSACAATKATIGTAWRNYGLSQSRGALPTGPLVIFVHIASVWVPFTSESKEAIAHYPEILKELKLALQDCGRKLGTYINKRKRALDAERKRSYIEKYIPHVGIALREILDLSEKQEVEVVETLTDTLERSRKL